MSHHQHYLRRRGFILIDKLAANIVDQRRSDLARDLWRGKQRILIAVFNRGQRLPLLRGFNLSPGDLLKREALIVLQGKGVHQRVADFQRAGDIGFLAVFRTEFILIIAAERALFFTIAGR